MTAPLDELYFEWLYSQVSDVRRRNKSHTYWELLRVLYTTEFIWFIPNDDNRCEDGRELRFEFFEQSREIMNVDNDWLDIGCCMLELLIGLSRRLNFEDDSSSARVWFWTLIDNLGFRDYNDRNGFDEKEVQDKLDSVIWRTYHYSGQGGLFPLHNPREDQRDVELWYQLNAYLLEQA